MPGLQVLVWVCPVCQLAYNARLLTNREVRHFEIQEQYGYEKYHTVREGKDVTVTVWNQCVPCDEK